MEMPGRSVRQPPEAPLEDALARLRSRWGTASIRLGNGLQTGGAASLHADPPPTHGALALAPAFEPDVARDPRLDPLAPLPDDVISTGFPALDAALGPGGLPRTASAAIRGDPCSGKTTLALRCAAEAQASGAIVAWLDLPRAFDPVDAIARGVDLRWLLVIRPADPAQGLTLAGALLSGRAVDLLVVDLPSGSRGGAVASARESERQGSTLRRLSAHARRVGARLIVLEPAALPRSLHGALAEVTGLRLELEREAWIRLDRDVVGQHTRVTVAKNRFGPPGRRVALEILYAEDGERRLATHRFATTHGPIVHDATARGLAGP